MHNDRKLFEFLILEGAQAGLAWQTMLNKRKTYREAFDGFRADRIVLFGIRDAERLLMDPGIVRNRLKIAATIQNAKAFLEIQKEFGSFDAYIWQFVGSKPIIHKIKAIKGVPTSIKESGAMSKDLIRRGFKFVGPKICYAFMRAVGMVNDHEVICFRYKGCQNQMK